MSASFCEPVHGGPPPPSALFQDLNIKAGIFQDQNMARIIPGLSPWFGLFLAGSDRAARLRRLPLGLAGSSADRLFRRFGGRHREGR